MRRESLGRSRFVPGDPRSQNQYGEFFQEFIERNNLTVLNALSLCEGLITRRRNKNGKIEESVLDFFVVCASVLPYITKMVIDEKKQHVLTNYHSAKKNGKATDSDHMTQYMDVNLNFIDMKPERQEMLNYKDTEGQAMFREITSYTNDFSKCFSSNIPLNKQLDKWRLVLSSYCNKSFKKIRIRKTNRKPIKRSIAILIDKRNCLRGPGLENEREELEKDIAKQEALEKRNEVMKNFKYFSENPEQINIQGMWKIMKKLSPKNLPTLPTAKRNHKGIIVSGPKEIKRLLAREYKNRLRTRPMRPDIISTKIRRKKIFQMKLKLSKSRPSKKWTMEHLETALKDLKKNKSRDSEGLMNELFKDGVIGDNLKESLLVMFNRLKEEKMIPKFFNCSNITTVPKKGSILDLENQRGIFRVSVVRSILMRLIYNEKYPIIDKNMSDCQMGARKGKGCRHNIWLINGIIYEVLHSKKKNSIILQIYDYKQMFDSINLEEAISDIYDAGLNDDQLFLIYEANKEVQMAVKTPSGLTERQMIENTVLQCDTFGSILASVQVDNIGKEVEEEPFWPI